eukprot:COSAG03_NODE_19062_length_343_cov_0.844262_1_plen_67_part_10
MRTSARGQIIADYLAWLGAALMEDRTPFTAGYRLLHLVHLANLTDVLLRAVQIKSRALGLPKSGWLG